MVIRRLLLVLLLIQNMIANGQRAEGFFLQEFCFVDPTLLKTFKVDKIELEVFENNRKSGSQEVFLDSNQRLIKKVSRYHDSTQINNYESTSISQFACPSVKPDFIKQCESGCITRTETDGAYRITSFDTEGKVISDRWKPGANRFEINRQIIYTKEGLIDTIRIKDVKDDGSIDKRELLIYSYNNDQLTSITQLVSFSEGFEDAGKIKFKDLDCGLVKKMEGYAYFGRYKMRVEFKYYSKGKQVK